MAKVCTKFCIPWRRHGAPEVSKLKYDPVGATFVSGAAGCCVSVLRASVCPNRAHAPLAERSVGAISLFGGVVIGGFGRLRPQHKPVFSCSLAVLLYRRRVGRFPGPTLKSGIFPPRMGTPSFLGQERVRPPPVRPLLLNLSFSSAAFLLFSGFNSVLHRKHPSWLVSFASFRDSLLQEERPIQLHRQAWKVHAFVLTIPKDPADWLG